MKTINKKALFLTSLLLIFLISVSTAQGAFYRDLSVGSSGSDVYELQKLLNQDVRTRIALSGPGSPGYETNYFGELTRRAVSKFQEIYRNEVLVPAGLSSGNGFFGPLTKAKLLALQKVQVQPYGNLVTNYPVVASKAEDLSKKAILSGAHPNNLVGLDLYISFHKDLARKEGWSNEQISESVNSIYEAVATSTDLKAEFARRYREAEPLSAENILRKIGLKMSDVGKLAVSPQQYKEYGVFETAPLSPLASLMPVEDQPLAAIAGLTIDFGGRLYGTWPCICSGGLVWQLVVVGFSGMSPYNLLDYVIGTQMKSTYTLPYVGQVEGQYVPAAASVSCWQGVAPYCTVIPSMGIVYPAETGSSPPGS